MKKHFFYPLLLAGCLGMVTACGDDNDGTKDGDDNGGGNVVENIVTADDAQREIDRVGKELIRKIDADKLKPVIELARFCDSEFNNDYDEPVWVYPEEHPLNPDYGVRAIMRHISATAQGDFAGVVSLKRIVKTYALGDAFGIYTWDEDDCDWVKTPSTSELTFKFNHEGKACVVNVTKSGTEYTFTTRDDYNGIDQRIKIPATTVATVTEGGVQLAKLTVNVPECNQGGKNYKLNARLEVSDYTIEGEASDNNSSVFATCYMSAGSERLAEGVFNVTGNKLADDEAFADDNVEVKDLHTGKGTITLLNSISLNAEVDNTAGLSDKLDYQMEWYHSEYFDSYMSEPSIYDDGDAATVEADARAAADAANKDARSSLTFVNGSYVAPVEWEAYLSYSYSWDNPGYDGYYSRGNYGGWDIRPVIRFDNGSRYTFDDYFTAVRFSSLISAFESLARDFEY